MGKAVSQQHPAVVLRSHYVHLRALLVAALIAVLGLTTAVVIVANDDDAAVTTNTPVPAIEGSTGATAIPQRGALPQRSLDGAVDTAPAPRYDGGPNEGSADVTTGHLPRSAPVAPQTGSPRYDGGPNEGSADVTTGHLPCSASVMPQTGSSPCGGSN
jgi:hypothetical protein